MQGKQHHDRAKNRLHIAPQKVTASKDIYAFRKSELCHKHENGAVRQHEKVATAAVRKKARPPNMLAGEFTYGLAVAGRYRDGGIPCNQLMVSLCAPFRRRPRSMAVESMALSSEACSWIRRVPSAVTRSGRPS